MEKHLHAEIKVKTVRYFKEETNFGIITFKILKMLEHNEVTDFPTTLVAKGIMPEPSRDAEFVLEAKEVIDPRWGQQYNIEKMYSNVVLAGDDKESQRKFLETVFTPNQVEQMYQTLENPYQAFQDNDAQSLLKIKGCGFKTAAKWLEKFKANVSWAKIFVELPEYNFTANMIKKLVDHYSSPDLVIEKVKKNPYELVDIEGIGWRTCDTIALKGGMSPQSPERIEAFIKLYLKDAAYNGLTYVDANEQLLQDIITFMGEDIPDEPILEAIHKLDNILWWSEDRKYVGLKYYVNLELKIAKKIIELRDSPNRFKYDNWERILHNKEENQGWNYSSQQVAAIKAILDEQVVIVTGGAGTGKSSIVAAVVDILQKYSYAQCALSGKAAARLTEVTGQEGYTIHRLLGYPKGDEGSGKFFYCEDIPLDYDVVIVDEISMVSGDLFWNLIRALKPGTKLILLGDTNQLESIGCSNIAHDLIESPEITSAVLTEIHRQAAASAIVTDSIKVCKGQQLIEKDWVGQETRGELQDLTYDCYSDKNNTFFKILEWAEMLHNKNIPIKDLQVIVPVKETQSGAWNLNLALQEIFNPLDGREELYVSYGKDKMCGFRTGDKVINIQNNYESYDCDGNSCPIFNGNMGVVLSIDIKARQMIVDYIGIGKVIITSKMLNQTMLGYAITVHKSQGSESKYIIFGIDYYSYSLLSRQMVYTAITRASKHCYIVAQNTALRYAVSVNNISKKQTLLKDALYSITHPVF